MAFLSPLEIASLCIYTFGVFYLGVYRHNPPVVWVCVLLFSGPALLVLIAKNTNLMGILCSVWIVAASRLAVQDRIQFRLSNRMTLGLIVLILTGVLVFGLQTSNLPPTLAAILLSVVISAISVVISHLRPAALGMGDVKLLASAQLLVASNSVNRVWMLYLCLVASGLLTVILEYLREPARFSPKSRIPMGAAIAWATTFTLVTI